MLSLAKSRHTHFFRLGLIATNIMGVLFGVSYKSKTADLYPGSLHSAMGWIVTAIAAAQGGHLLLGPVIKLFSRIAGRDERRTDGYTRPSMREISDSLQGHDSPSCPPLDVEATPVDEEDNDTSADSRLFQEELPESGFTSGDDTFHGDSDSVQTLQHDDHEPITGASKMFSRPILTRTRRLVQLYHNVLDRTILLVAFVAFCTGIATYWGLFVSSATPRTTLVDEIDSDLLLPERARHAQRHRPLDQRWRFPLARHFQSRSLVRVLCRHWMGEQD